MRQEEGEEGNRERGKEEERERRGRVKHGERRDRGWWKGQRTEDRE